MAKELTNQERGQRANEALIVYARRADRSTELKQGGDIESLLSDMLADLQHLCDRDGLDFARALRLAALHHDAETKEVI